MIRFSTLFTSILLPYVFAAPQVTLNHTTVVGLGMEVSGQQQDFFGGLPFAQAVRFGPPLPTSLKGETFDATRMGALCAQPEPTDYITTEDCLTLDLYRPSNLKSLVPVLVYIPGGGFQEQGETWNGSTIVTNSVSRGTPLIYAVMNYRVGPLGFPQGDEAVRKGALNLGLKDQLAALQWLHKNVASFGGDPSKITIFGDSAGAQSIALLYLNSGLENLVRGAIFESGSQATIPISNATLRTPAWEAFVNATPECAGASAGNTFDCLRSASLENIYKAWNVTSGATFLLPFANSTLLFPFTPVIDGEGGLIPDSPAKLLASGHFSRIPFMAGANLDEGPAATATGLNYTDPEVTVEYLHALDRPYTPNISPEFKATTEHLLSLYPDNPALGAPFGTGNNTFGFNPHWKRTAALMGDFLFHALRRAWSQAAARYGVKNYGYLFADQDAVLPQYPWAGVAHALEGPYVYGQVLNGTATQVAMSLMMMDYWASFATSLDPNDGRGVSRPRWEQYDLSNPVILQFERVNTSLVPDTYRAKEIAYINSFPELYDH